MRKAVVIINAGSGTGSDDEVLTNDIRSFFAAHDIEADIKLAENGKQLSEFCRRSSPKRMRDDRGGGR